MLVQNDTLRNVLFLIYMVTHWTIISTNDGWPGCSVNVCGWPRQKVTCNNSVILIENVTSAVDGSFDEHAFHNIRRMCMGKSVCNQQKFCHNEYPGQSLKVTYVCVEGHNILKACESRPQERYRGFILSPDYPAGSQYTQCKWRIKVPPDYYVVLRLHELEFQSLSRNAQCEGGLKFKTDSTCEERPFPNHVVCGVPVNEKIDENFVACGDINITLSASGNGETIRFWLSYQVKRLSTRQEAAPMAGLVRPCPAFTTEERLESFMGDGPIPERFPVRTVIEVTPSVNANKTDLPDVFESNEKSPSPTVDTTERTVLYVAVAVAAASLIALVIVAIICLRRQMVSKYDQTVMQNGIQQPYLSQQQRPLPDLNESKTDTVTSERPVLQDGYSRVADEIPTSDVTPTSPAYAEVEESMEDPNSRIVFKFNSQREAPKPTPKPAFAYRKPVEHLYSEPDEVLSQSVHPHFQQTADELHRDKTSNKNDLVSDSSPDNFSGVEGPYASCDIIYCTDSDSRVQLLSRSESDDSLVLTENEIYEPFESAHV